MKLKRLEISGFKSFRDKTVFDFSSGISAVVGPNGCGKSNIVDAIRWVMGEQRVRSLRGKSMEDVIFHGSEEAYPIGMAEVSLIIQRGEQPFPGGLADCVEVMITRRLTRQGESEYYLNKARVRHLDIREFFMDSGVGAKSYSLVEQNSVSLMVESKPEDIRLYIDEAAGISKYKGRREIASRKLEATRQNLLRLTDIIQEVKKGLATTTKQAKRAAQYKNLKQEIKQREITLALNAYFELALKRDQLALSTEELRKDELAANTQAAVFESLLEEAKNVQQEQEQEVLHHKERIYKLESTISIEEQEISHARSRAVELAVKRDNILHEIQTLKFQENEMTSERDLLEAKISDGKENLTSLKEKICRAEQEINMRRASVAEAQREMDEKKIQLFDLAQEKVKLSNHQANLIRISGDLKKRLASVQTEEKEQRRRLTELEHLLADLRSRWEINERNLTDIKEKKLVSAREEEQARQEMSDLDELLSELKIEKGKNSSRLQSLKDFSEGYTWCSEGTRSIMNIRQGSQTGRLNGSSFLGILGDYIDVPKEYETAVEVALGEKLQYIAVKSHRDAIEGIEYLKTQGTGRGSFVPLDVKPESPEHNYENEVPGAVRLIGVVKFREDFQKLGESLLGDVFLTGEIETGVALWQKNGIRCSFVTPDGDLVSSQGVVTGGFSGNGHSGFLPSRREIAELNKIITNMENDIHKATLEKKAAQTAIFKWQEELKNLRADQHRLELQIHGQKKDLERYSDESRRVNQRLNVLGHTGEQLVAEAEASKTRGDQIREELEEILGREKSLSGELEALKDKWKSLQDGLRVYEGQLLADKLLMNSCHEQREANIKSLRRIEEALLQMEGRVEMKTKDIDICQSQTIKLKDAIITREEALGRLYLKKEETEALLVQRKDNLTKTEETLRAHQLEISRLRNSGQSLVKELSAKEIDLREAAFQLEALTKAIASRYQLDLNQPLAYDKVSQKDLEVLEEEVRKKRDILESFGEVNLLALDEHEKLMDRHRFLSEQALDLKASIESLQKTIVRINQLTRRRFAETFAAISESFAEVFTLIFPGGQGKLRLTDAENLLETGVDMEIQIPGKRVQALALLSGGEKTLAAIALIFSILRYRPAPFLILDEIDAALDDANIAIFNRLLSDTAEKSQVIIVTHNKLTMEAADSLFGITLQKQGISSVISVNLN